MKFKKNITAILITLLFSQNLLADMFKTTLFTLNTIYIDRDYSNGGVTSKSKATDTDFRLMRIEKHWAYGLIYAQSSNDSSDANRSSYGLSVSYFSEKDFYLSANYFLSSKYQDGTGEYTKGNGYEIDLGFLSKITSSFYVGLLFALKNFTYSERNVSGVNSGASLSHREVLPMFSFGVNFR